MEEQRFYTANVAGSIPARPTIMKRCPKCGGSKPATLEFFYKGKKWRDGFKPYCKKCQIAQTRQWVVNNKDRWRIKSRESAKRRSHVHMEYKRRWIAANPEKVKAMSARAEAKKAARPKTPKQLLSKRMRSALRRALGSKNGRSWQKILGYTSADLRAHIKSRFLPRMGWHNAHLWHIDHIRPIASFRYESEADAEFKKCWSLENLAPLWAIDNLRKSKKCVTSNAI